MSWKEQNALKRVFNVFMQFKALKGKLWDNDIQAIETLQEGLENRVKSDVVDNILFAKLLAMQLRQEINHFGNINQAIKNLGVALGQPLDYHIENIRLELNNVQDMAYFKDLGLDFEVDNKESRLAMDQILKDKEQEIIKKIPNYWKYDVVSKSFYNTANSFIKDIDNYS